MRVLAAMDYADATARRDTTYGLLAAASQAMDVSKATVSRDFALVRRIHRQFGRMSGATSIRRVTRFSGIGTGRTTGL
jgi:hypothetical protein